MSRERIEHETVALLRWRETQKLAGPKPTIFVRPCAETRTIKLHFSFCRPPLLFKSTQVNWSRAFHTRMF